MKKNVMMRVASALLVAVLLTTCSISGTFAKYVTQDSGSDVARVAKWGVELQVAGTLYGEKYEDGVSSKPTASTNADDFSVAVDAHGGKIVAPGTENDKGLGFKLNGTPEVDGKVTITIAYENIYLKEGTYGVMVLIPDDFVTVENFNSLGTVYTYDIGTEIYTAAASYAGDVDYYTLEDSVTITDYYPVEYKMNGTKANYNTLYDQGVATDTLAGAVAVIATPFGTATSTDVTDGLTTKTWKLDFKANQNLADVVKLADSALCWKWDIENNNTPCTAGDASCGFCKADTIIANLQAGNVAVVKSLTADTFKAPEAAVGADAKDYNLDTSFSINITVEQVD